MPRRRYDNDPLTELQLRTLRFMASREGVRIVDIAKHFGVSQTVASRRKAVIASKLGLRPSYSSIAEIAAAAKRQGII